jgi:hypothetical protein
MRLPRTRHSATPAPDAPIATARAARREVNGPLRARRLETRTPRVLGGRAPQRRADA